MPAAAFIIPAIISATASTTTAAIQAKNQSRAAARASAAQATSEASMLANQRLRDEQEREENARIREEDKRRYDAEQAFLRETYEEERGRRTKRDQADDEDRAYELSLRAERARGRERDPNQGYYEPAGPPAPTAAQQARAAALAKQRALQQNALTSLGSLLNQGTPGYGRATAGVYGNAAPVVGAGSNFTLGSVLPVQPGLGVSGIQAPAGPIGVGTSDPLVPGGAPTLLPGDPRRVTEIPPQQGFDIDEYLRRLQQGGVGRGYA